MPATLLAAAVVPAAAAVLDVAVAVFGAVLVVAGRAEADVAAALARADEELLAEDVGLLPGEVAGLAVLGGYYSKGLFRPGKRPQYRTEVTI